MTIQATTGHPVLFGGPSQVIVSFADRKTLYRFLAVSKSGPLTQAALRFIEKPYSQGTVGLMSLLNITLARLPSINPSALARVQRQLDAEEDALDAELSLMTSPLMKFDPEEGRVRALNAPSEVQNGKVIVHLETFLGEYEEPAKLSISGPDAEDGLPQMELTYYGPEASSISREDMLQILAGEHPFLRIVPCTQRAARPKQRMHEAKEALIQTASRIQTGVKNAFKRLFQ